MQISALQGSIVAPQRASRYRRSRGSGRNKERPPHTLTAMEAISGAVSIATSVAAQAQDN